MASTQQMGEMPKQQNADASVSENPSKDLEKMIDLYLASNPMHMIGQKVNELEIRFGTSPSKNSRPITKIDYDNVIKQLYSAGFTTDTPSGVHMLRINTERIDKNTGRTLMSNIRAEIVGLDLIQKYCQTNSIQKLMTITENSWNSNYKVKFTEKNRPRNPDNSYMKPVKFDDHNFSVSYQIETDMTNAPVVTNSIIRKWSDSKKIFRYINRVKFTHPEYPVLFDVSIIKSSRKIRNVPIPQYDIQDANVFNNIESYEVEMEILNHMVGVGTPYNTSTKIIDMIRKGVRIVLSALQGTNYPVTYSEQDTTIQKYMQMLYGEEYQPRKVLLRDFIGPSSYTLQHENAIVQEELTNIPNIRNHYTVTDKADGERKLLYVCDNGRIYMIDTNMSVIFTGVMTEDKEVFNTIMDGEHIKYDKNGKYVNLFAAFDIYYLNGKSVRELSFMKIEGQEEELDNKFRLLLLQKTIKRMKPYSVVEKAKMKKDETSGVADTSVNTQPCDFIIKCKNFYMGEEGSSIFEKCNLILTNIRNGIYEYNTDGLIFTPCVPGVGGMVEGETGPLKKTVWDMSFKWKPASFNTVDFLVSIKKDKGREGTDAIYNIFQEGVNLTSGKIMKQYKTLVLRCGFDEKKHGIINPYQNILDDKIPVFEDIDNEDTYRPVPFQPTNPYDPTACFSNVLLSDNGNGNMSLFTEEGEYFEEDMIVEFKYVMENDAGWRWVPLRVRYDKTSKLRAGISEYGNPYHVAMSNWKSIHNPITEEMISTGEGFIADEDVYYNRAPTQSNLNHYGNAKTNSLRNFHNLYVKNKLIKGVSEPQNILIDFAVGKAGDFSKWIQSKLKFVFGIDISKDNIHNNIDGACSRYLMNCKKFKRMPSALFTVGNSAYNIRTTGDAFSSEKDKIITKAVFGVGPKDRKILGEGVYKHYGIAHDGFHISSCQFALHYFFETPASLHNFLRNLTECTKLNGYFIGTCYDGKTIFNNLKKKNEGEGILIMKENVKIYELVKMYSQTGFPNDENSIGYKIKVYQETINKYFEEYLVNFEYFKQMMENYGFVLVTDEEAGHMGFKSGTGMFGELFSSMENEIKRYPANREKYGDAANMTEEERRISFMNRYFIFKKVRNIGDTQKISKLFHVIEKESEKAEENYEEEHDAIQLSRDLLKNNKKEDTEMNKMEEADLKKNKKDENKKDEKIEKMDHKEKDGKEKDGAKKMRKTQKIKKVKFTIEKYSPIQESL
jgi:hypothetical protein